MSSRYRPCRPPGRAVKRITSPSVSASPPLTPPCTPVAVVARRRPLGERPLRERSPRGELPCAAPPKVVGDAANRVAGSQLMSQRRPSRRRADLVPRIRVSDTRLTSVPEDTAAGSTFGFLKRRPTIVSARKRRTRGSRACAETPLTRARKATAAGACSRTVAGTRSRDFELVRLEAGSVTEAMRPSDRPSRRREIP